MSWSRRAPSDPGRKSSRGCWAPWALLAVLHAGLHGLLAEAIPPVFLELPLLAALGWQVRRGRAPAELFCCFFTVCAYLLSEPSVGFAAAIWVSLIPLLIVIERERRIWVLGAMGLWTGWMIAAGVYAWLIPSIAVFFETPRAAAWPAWGAAALVIGAPFALFMPLARFLHERLGWPLALVAPPLFALLEYWRPSPFPLDAALALVWQPLWLQPLDLAGAQGVALLVAAVNAGVFAAVRALAAGDRSSARRAAVAAAGIFALHTGYGLWAMNHYASSPGAPSLDVAVVQPVAPLKILNADAALQAETAAVLRDLSLRAAGSGERPPDLLIWPEGAGPFASRTPEFNPSFMEAVRSVQESAPVPILLHNIEFDSQPGGGRRGYYSAITLVEPPARPAAGYHKAILMPFSEFIPFERLFPFLRRWLPQSRSILRGGRPRPLPAPGGPAAPLICYETLFADHVRALVRQDAAWIVNLTNDRWYGRRQQPPQHLAFAVLRSIENRRPTVRAANSGISALIDARGVIAPGASTRVLERGFLRGTIHPRSGRTVFTRFGDVLHGWLLPLVFLIALVRVLAVRRQGHVGKTTQPDRKP